MCRDADEQKLVDDGEAVIVNAVAQSDRPEPPDRFIADRCHCISSS